MSEDRQRWYAVKIFERDEKVLEELEISAEKRSHIEKDIVAVEAELDDDAEAIITNERYVYITNLLSTCYKKKHAGRLTLSDKIDRIATNRILALPIFALVMFCIYAIAMGNFPFSIGTMGTDFANDKICSALV